jgi:very-short-patch-repair endonuclease
MPVRRNGPGEGSPKDRLETVRFAATRRELIDEFGRYAVDRDVRSGSVIRLLPDTYVATSRSDAFATRAAAALFWAGDASALGGAAAAHAYRLLREPPELVEICVPRSSNPRGPTWIRVLQPSSYDPSSSRIVGGLRCVPVCDAIVQAWSALGTGPGTSLIIGAVRARTARADAIARRANAYPRIPARRALIDLLTLLADGVDSYLERIAATRVFTGREFGGFSRQHSMRVRGRLYVLDMWDAEARVAVELDGRAFHGDELARRRDLERDTDLASVGVVTVRFTFEDITGRPEWCRSRLRSVLRARRRAANWLPVDNQGRKHPRDLPSASATAR